MSIAPTFENIFTTQTAGARRMTATPYPYPSEKCSSAFSLLDDDYNHHFWEYPPHRLRARGAWLLLQTNFLLKISHKSARYSSWYVKWLSHSLLRISATQTVGARRMTATLCPSLPVLTLSHHVRVNVYIHVCACVSVHESYGVATIGRLLTIIGLFCKRAL